MKVRITVALLSLVLPFVGIGIALNTALSFPKTVVNLEPFIFFVIPAILLGIFSILSVKLSTHNIRIVSPLFLLVLLSLIVARPYVWLPGVIALFGGIILFLVTSRDDISNREGKRAA
jgi:hypothetical protein